MSDRKFDAESIADAWWAGDIDRSKYVDDLTINEFRVLRAEIAAEIKQHEIRLNRLHNLRDELRERTLKAMGADQ